MMERKRKFCSLYLLIGSWFSRGTLTKFENTFTKLRFSTIFNKTPDFSKNSQGIYSFESLLLKNLGHINLWRQLLLGERWGRPLKVWHFADTCWTSNVVFHQWLPSIEVCLPSKGVFYQRSSYIKGLLLSKVFFYQSSSSIKGRLPLKVETWV